MIEDMQWLSWWHHADVLIKMLFVTLVALSLISWSVILFKSWQFWHLGRLERRITHRLLKNDLGENWRTTIAPATVSFLVFRDLSHMAMGHDHGGDAQNSAHHLEHHADLFIQGHRVELENGLTVLATIGNSAPFIGLLGTVWGIMNALAGLDSLANLTLDLIAGPVAEALVATAVGLFAAIPAVIGYNYLVRRLRRLNAVIERNLRHLIHLGV